MPSTTSAAPSPLALGGQLALEGALRLMMASQNSHPVRRIVCPAESRRNLVINLEALVKKKATKLDRITYLVFDEADRMFDLGFGKFFLSLRSYEIFRKNESPHPVGINHLFRFFF